MTLASRIEGDDNTPRWQTLGAFSIEAEELVKIVVEGPKAKPGEEETKADQSQAKNAKTAPPPPVPVPALLALSTDANYDPSAALDLIRARTGFG